MGAGWTVNDSNFERLSETANKIRHFRDDTQEVKDFELKLAALMYSFEQMINNQKFDQAYPLITPILACMDNKPCSIIAR